MKFIKTILENESARTLVENEDALVTHVLESFIPFIKAYNEEAISANLDSYLISENIGDIYTSMTEAVSIDVQEFLETVSVIAADTTLSIEEKLEIFDEIASELTTEEYSTMIANNALALKKAALAKAAAAKSAIASGATAAKGAIASGATAAKGAATAGALATKGAAAKLGTAMGAAAGKTAAGAKLVAAAKGAGLTAAGAGGIAAGGAALAGGLLARKAYKAYKKRKEAKAS